MADTVTVRGPDGTLFRFDADASASVIDAVFTEYYGAGSAEETSRLQAAAEGVADGFGFGFNDELQGLQAAAQADTRPRGLDRFRDDEGNVVTDALGVAGDLLTAGSPMVRGAIDRARGFTPEQQAAYEQARDIRREALDASQEAHPLSTVGGAVGGGILSAALTGGAAAAPATLRSAAAIGAGTGALYGVGSGETTGDRVAQGAVGGLTGALAGAGTQVALNGAGGLLRRVRVRPQATPVQRAQSARTAGRLDDAAVERVTDAEALGVPLSRGQVTRSSSDLGFEDAARHDALGIGAGQTMTQFDEAQRAALDEAATGLRRGLSGTGDDVAETALDAGGFIGDRLQDARSARETAARAAYDAAQEADTVVQTEPIQRLGDTVRRSLSAQGDEVFIDANTPMGVQAMQVIDDAANLRFPNAVQSGTRAVTEAGDDVTIAGVRIQGLDRTRRRLVGLRRSAGTDEDRRAVTRVIRAFDDWLDDTAEQGLLIGTDDGIEAYRRARQIYAGTRRQFMPQGPGDPVGRMIDQISSGALDDAKVIANYIYGSARSGHGRNSMNLVRRITDIFGRESVEVDAVRQGLLARLMGASEGRRDLGMDAIIGNFRNFLDGEGRQYARLLFTPEQLQELRRFYNVLRAIPTPERLRNTSRTAYVQQRLRASGSTLAQAFGQAPIIGQMVNLVNGGLSGLVNASRARSAILQAVPPLRGVPGAVLSGAGIAPSASLDAQTQQQTARLREGLQTPQRPGTGR